jgi:hypothetical protein
MTVVQTVPHKEVMDTLRLIQADQKDLDSRRAAVSPYLVGTAKKELFWGALRACMKEVSLRLVRHVQR